MATVMMTLEEFLEHLSEVIKLSSFLFFIKRLSHFEERVIMRYFLFTVFAKIEINTSRALVSDSVDRVHVAILAANSGVDKVRNNLIERLFTFENLFSDNRKHVVDPFINHLCDDLVKETFDFLHVFFLVARPISWTSMIS